jgi:pyruvate kinase
MAPGSRLETGAEFELRHGDGEGDPGRAFVDDALFFDEVRVGDRLLVADGAIELAIETQVAGRLGCRVIAGGVLPSRKGVNVPRGLLRRPVLSRDDLEDLAAGVSLGVDLVAVSYVRGAEDLRAVRRALRDLDAATPLVAKIETASAIANLGAILDATDAVMLARGDLAIETPFERVPMEQKRILEAARRRGRPVITATQLLGSMVSEPRPTRAEVNDVANAVLDGTDALMLSEETAIGTHPVLAVATMARIAVATELEAPDLLLGPEGLSADIQPLGVVAESAARTARAIGARALVAWTRGGLGARLLSRATRGIPILAPARRPEAARLLAVLRGVTPLPAADGSIDAAHVRRILGVSAGDDAPLVLLGHDVGPGGRRIPWMRVAHLDEPDSWTRDPAPLG